MVVVGQVEIVRHTQRVGLIDSKTQHCGEYDARSGEHCNDRERGSVRSRERPHPTSYKKDTVSEQTESNLRVCECGIAILGSRLVHAQPLITPEGSTKPP